MRSLSIIAGAYMTVSGVLAFGTTAMIDINTFLGFDAGPSSLYNAHSPPWVHGTSPGWYYGSQPENYPDLWCLDEFMCKFLSYYPGALQCPIRKPVPTPTTTVIKTTTATTTATVTVTVTATAEDGYIQTFSNITAAVQADDFMTFGLVETVADCMAMCDSVPGCTFVNSYHDVNGKGGSTDLTCSLFQFCHTAANADNFGGQSQPDGSLDFIIDSDGWCKVGNSPPTSPAPSPSSTTTSSTTTSHSVSSTTTSKTTSSTSSNTTSTTTTKTTSTTTAKTTSTTTTKKGSPPVPTPPHVGHFQQCGGFGFEQAACVAPFKCVALNPFYSQCL